MNAPPTLLSGRGIKKYYPVMKGILRRVVGYVKALDGIDFDLNPGDVLGVVGETGSGKSTLGKTALRLIEPTAGALSYCGNDLLSYRPKELKTFRKDAQIIFQDPMASLNPRKTILESIGEGLLFHGLVKTASEEKERVAEVLTQVGLEPDMMSRFPHQFSGGQQQRICIGRAIALKPRLIVCDEALSALDVLVQAQILNLLLELKEKLHLSYLFISHDLSSIKYLCDHVMVLYLGKVMEVASAEDIFHKPCHPYTQALLSAIPKDHPSQRKSRIILKGEMPSALNPPSGCPFRTRCPYAQPICSKTPPKKIIPNLKSGALDHEYHCILDE